MGPELLTGRLYPAVVVVRGACNPGFLLEAKGEGKSLSIHISKTQRDVFLTCCTDAAAALPSVSWVAIADNTSALRQSLVREDTRVK